MMENTNSAISPDGLIGRHPHQHSIDGILAGQLFIHIALEIIPGPMMDDFEYVAVFFQSTWVGKISANQEP